MKKFVHESALCKQIKFAFRFILTKRTIFIEIYKIYLWEDRLKNICTHTYEYLNLRIIYLL